MSDDENLDEALNKNWLAEQRAVAIRTLGSRAHLTIGRIAQLLDNETHGEMIKSIALQELLDEATANVAAEPAAAAAAATAPATAPRKTAPRKTAKKKAAKKASAKKAPRKKKAKKTAKKKAKRKASASGKKADYGKKKPRLNYDVGCKECLAALRAIKAPASNGQVCATTNYSSVQVRAFLKRLVKDKKIKVQGKGKATKYSLK